eukprot:6452709-Pyramimonas_sp.AAC.1
MGGRRHPVSLRRVPYELSLPATTPAAVTWLSRAVRLVGRHVGSSWSQSVCKHVSKSICLHFAGGGAHQEQVVCPGYIHWILGTMMVTECVQT